MMKYKEETLRRYSKIVTDYCDNENVYDIVKYATINGETSFKSVDDWVAFVKTNFDEEEYKKFVSKAMPFWDDDGNLDEEYKQNVCKICQDVFQKKAGLIEVIDNVTPNMNKFIYMAKQLRFYYKDISSHVFNEMAKFYNKMYAYDNKKTLFNTSVTSLSERDSKYLLDFIENKGLLLNNITYEEAYYYLKNRNLIGDKKRVR